MKNCNQRQHLCNDLVHNQSAVTLHLQYSLSDEPPADEDEKAHLTDDFYYERPGSLFNPLLTEGVPHDLLSLQYPFHLLKLFSIWEATTGSDTSK